LHWEEYQIICNNSLQAISKSSLINLIAGDIFKDFPQNLPSNIKDGMNAIFKFLMDNFNKKSKGEKLEQPKDVHHDFMKYFIPFVGVFSSTNENIETAKIDFEQSLLSQELVIILAYLEAFLLDSENVMFRKNYNLLKSFNKEQLDWAEILNHTSFDSLIDKMISKRLSKSSYGSAIDKIGRLETQPFNLNLNISTRNRILLERATDVRNLYVHKGGKIDLEFQNKYAEDDFTEGIYYILKHEENVSFSTSISIIISEIFASVSVKFFNKDYEESYKKINRAIPENTV